jgi:hypothetical protein
MLSKTAMALLPAASLVGAAALAPTGKVEREPRFHRRQLSLLPGKRLEQQVSGRPSRPLSRRVVSTDRVEPTSKEIEQSRVTNATCRAN